MSNSKRNSQPKQARFNVDDSHSRLTNESMFDDGTKAEFAQVDMDESASQSSSDSENESNRCTSS